MSAEELKKLLWRINSLDHRKLSDAVFKAWWPLMEHIEYADAVEAVNVHFRDSTAYLLPGHVVANAKRIVRARRDSEHAEDWRNDDKPGIPMPPRFFEAVDAARQATASLVAAGHTHGSDIVKQAALAAAKNVLEND